MLWTVRERLMGDNLTREFFPFQCTRTGASPMSVTQPTGEALDFCRETFGQGSYATIMGTGHWMWGGSSRWIFQRDFIAFRCETDRLVFLLKTA